MEGLNNLGSVEKINKEKYNKVYEFVNQNNLMRHPPEGFASATPEGIFIRNPEKIKNFNETSLVLSNLGCVSAFQFPGKGEVLFNLDSDSYDEEAQEFRPCKEDISIYLDIMKVYANNVEEGETLKISPSGMTVHTNDISKWQKSGFELTQHKEGGRSTLEKIGK